MPRIEIYGREASLKTQGQSAWDRTVFRKVTVMKVSTVHRRRTSAGAGVTLQWVG